jgi:hypothetical protein
MEHKKKGKKKNIFKHVGFIHIVIYSIYVYQNISDML